MYIWYVYIYTLCDYDIVTCRYIYSNIPECAKQLHRKRMKWMELSVKQVWNHRFTNINFASSLGAPSKSTHGLPIRRWGPFASLLGFFDVHCPWQVQLMRRMCFATARVLSMALDVGFQICMLASETMWLQYLAWRPHRNWKPKVLALDCVDWAASFCRSSALSLASLH